MKTCQGDSLHCCPQEAGLAITNERPRSRTRHPNATLSTTKMINSLTKLPDLKYQSEWSGEEQHYKRGYSRDYLRSRASKHHPSEILTVLSRVGLDVLIDQIHVIQIRQKTLRGKYDD